MFDVIRFYGTVAQKGHIRNLYRNEFSKNTSKVSIRYVSSVVHHVQRRTALKTGDSVLQSNTQCSTLYEKVRCISMAEQNIKSQNFGFYNLCGETYSYILDRFPS